MTTRISREKARAQGLKFYFTGKPCKNKHVALRRVSNKDCINCMNEKEDKRFCIKGVSSRRQKDISLPIYSCMKKPYLTD